VPEARRLAVDESLRPASSRFSPCLIEPMGLPAGLCAKQRIDGPTSWGGAVRRILVSLLN